MRILVTGGAGFIGSMLVSKLLGKGYFVRAFDNLLYGDKPLFDFRKHPKFELVVGDCRLARKVYDAAKGMDAVVHTAAIVGVPACDSHRELAKSTNDMGTQSVVLAAGAANCKRFIHLSTYAVYGKNDGYVSEESPFNPRSLYAETKAKAETHVSMLENATILRLATNYGMSHRPRFDLVVNLLTGRAVQEGMIYIFGGQQWRSFMHVKDAVTAIMLALKAPKEAVAGQAFNVGDKSGNYRLIDVGKAVTEIVFNTRLIMVDPQDDCSLQVCYEKIKQMLGFKCFYQLKYGIAEVASAVMNEQVGNCRDAEYSNFESLK